MGRAQAPGSLRTIRRISKAALFSVRVAALGGLACTTTAPAQTVGTAPTSPAGSQLPPIEITSPEVKRRANSAPAQRADRGAQKRRSQAARRPEPQAAPKPAFGVSQDARTGTVGVYANSTSVATKTNTPLVDIPQSLSVLTKDFIRDQGFQGLTDVTRYVPGVAVHQGEGNRDELVIRGVDSSANFFVNGFRDDVQYFRDLYNAQSVEVLKGPSALTFGRGAGGGLLNHGGVLGGQLGQRTLVLCSRGSDVGALGLQDLTGPQHSQDTGHVVAHLPDPGRVVQLAGGQLEAQVEQLTARLAQAGRQLVAVEHGKVVRSGHQMATSACPCVPGRTTKRALKGSF